jgi:hypothetical protein
MKSKFSLSIALTLTAFVLLLTADPAYAQSAGAQRGKTDNAQGQKWGSFDDDGDGILNCQDPDYVRPQDGSGKQLGKMSHKGGKIGNGGSCTGNGGMVMGKGTGVCDGTGPKGKGRTK